MRSTAEALGDPQLEVNKMLVEVDHAQVGLTRHVGTPLRLSGTPAAQARTAPMLGDDSARVLRANGFSNAEVEALLAEGIIA